MALLRSPRWLVGLLVAVLFALACVWLAQWQLDRRIARAEANAAVLENYDAAGVPLADVLAEGVDPREEWTPVLLRGEYSPEDTLLVRNRPQEGSNGYLVVVPLRLAPDDGAPSSIWVVRGWVPSGRSADAPDQVPAPPSGPVEVLARVRAAEPASDRVAPQGQTYRLDPGGLRDAGVEVSSAFVVQATERPGAASGIVTVQAPDTDPGPHLAYGVQWYLFAVAGFVIWGVLFRRHALADHASPVQVGAPRRGRESWTYAPGGHPDG